MKASELRIGNFIEFRHYTMGWSQPTVCEAWMIADCLKHPESYRDILITEEWLLKFGFEYKIEPHYKTWKFINDVFYSYNYKGDFRWFSKVLPNIDKVKYVHQLQNLYFALTGEELTLK